MSANFPHDVSPLKEGARALGIALTEDALERFRALAALLLNWNERFNLTAITDPAEVVTRHLLDSLTCVLALDDAEMASNLSLLDVGSGAGFPCLPLAIAFPHWRVTSLEATEKKVRFQREVIRALDLVNIEARAGRSEDLARNVAFRGSFHVVTARAVAALPTLLEYCCPFVEVGGQVVALKQGDLTEELVGGARAAKRLGAKLLEPIAVSLPQLPEGRCVVSTRQVTACPEFFPRAAGAPRKKPLG